MHLNHIASPESLSIGLATNGHNVPSQSLDHSLQLIADMVNEPLTYMRGVYIYPIHNF